jgi:hypothetical protein
MPNRKTIAIIGAGHNALVCACYLAKAGHDVTVFERRVGGAVNTEELWPGYQVDTCSVMLGSRPCTPGSQCYPLIFVKPAGLGTRGSSSSATSEAAGGNIADKSAAVNRQVAV